MSFLFIKRLKSISLLNCMPHRKHQKSAYDADKPDNLIPGVTHRIKIMTANGVKIQIGRISDCRGDTEYASYIEIRHLCSGYQGVEEC